MLVIILVRIYGDFVAEGNRYFIKYEEIKCKKDKESKKEQKKIDGGGDQGTCDKPGQCNAFELRL